MENDTPVDRTRSFFRDALEPSYLALLADGHLSRKMEAARQELASCRACPRRCDVNRLAGEVGICRGGEHPLVASAFPHHGEESCLTGHHGSGTIFFSSCNLHCVFCQNWELSQRPNGEVLTPAQIASAMMQLQAWGCHNINFVTPEHVVPQVIEAIGLAVQSGLRLPIVYNTSAYDSLDSLRRLDGLIDIYMPDFKFWARETARRLCKAEDYPERARAAIREMHRQVGPLVFDRDGIAQRGVLVRHLVMPGLGPESEAIFHWLATEVSPDTFVNIMGQYRPSFRVGEQLPSGIVRYEEINRSLRAREMEAAFAAARAAGLWRFDKPR